MKPDSHSDASETPIEHDELAATDFESPCPHADGRGDPEHNVYHQEEGRMRDSELCLWVYARCSCGFEEEEYFTPDKS
jgi:hypothetical protein